jgi:hypothetical protein
MRCALGRSYVAFANGQPSPQTGRIATSSAGLSVYKHTPSFSNPATWSPAPIPITDDPSLGATPKQGVPQVAVTDETLAVSINPQNQVSDAPSTYTALHQVSHRQLLALA